MISSFQSSGIVLNYSAAFLQISKWFSEYSLSYLNKTDDCSNAAKLKFEHTFRVCEEIRLLSQSIKLSEKGSNLAAIIALLHDAGRYEQFLRYKTFSDHLSINHAELAVQIILEHKILNALDADDADLVITAVLYHNAKKVPASLNEHKQLFCSLIRDADKLDIFRIVTSNYSNPDLENKKAIQLGLTDTHKYSPEVCECVLNGSIVDYSKIKYLNDFKLAQIGWVYDLNFNFSFEQLFSRGYFQILKAQLPAIEDLTRAVSKAEAYLFRKISCPKIETI